MLISNNRNGLRHYDNDLNPLIVIGSRHIDILQKYILMYCKHPQYYRTINY